MDNLKYQNLTEPVAGGIEIHPNPITVKELIEYFAVLGYKPNSKHLSTMIDMITFLYHFSMDGRQLPLSEYLKARDWAEGKK